MRLSPARLAARALAGLLLAAAAASPSLAAYKVRIDYVRTSPTDQPTVFFGTENVSGAGSTPVLSGAAPSFAIPGVPSSTFGCARLQVLSGAVVFTMPGASPQGGEANGVRAQAGDPPVCLPITSGQHIAFTEAADAPVGGATDLQLDRINNAPYQGKVALTLGTPDTTSRRAVYANCTAAGSVTLQFADGSTTTWSVGIGPNLIPGAFLKVVSSTAACTFENWK